jgi:hypothetical protein
VTSFMDDPLPRRISNISTQKLLSDRGLQHRSV